MTLGRWLAAGELRAHPWRLLAALAAIAIGVALGLAVQLINASAVSEFAQAVRATTGQADLEVRGPRAGFDERVFERVATDPAVAVASPLLEMDLAVHADGAEETRLLKLIGLDVFLASQVTPELVGQPAQQEAEGDAGKAGNEDDAGGGAGDGGDESEGRGGLALLADDALFLSPAAQTWLGVQPGDTLTLRVGLAPVTLRVAGSLPGARPRQRLATLDLGTAQWRLARLGQLTRIALRLKPGADRAAVQARLAALLPAGVFIGAPSEAETRASNLSRAYRVNLNVLALVALFTGAFLVFSTQTLAVARRRGEFALLRTLGWTPAQLLRQVVAEGALIGLVGSVLGALLGIGVAQVAIRLFGGDLGGGYFAGVSPVLLVNGATVAAFIALGTLAATAGSFAPGLQIARAAPVPLLKGGMETGLQRGGGRLWPGLLLLALGALLTRLPPYAGLPVAGYLAIACWLVGGISLMPGLAGRVFARFAGLASRHAGRLPLTFLSLQRLAAAPGQAGIALSGVVASFALMVAMAVMVGSFRDAVDRWLGQVLVAPLYFRTASGAGGGSFVTPADLAAMAAQPGLARSEWMRLQPIDLDPARPPITLMAREVDPQRPHERLALTGTALTTWPAGTTPVWVSEAMVDLYGWTLGRQVSLPLAGQAVPVTVAGIWRDFARQHGTVALALADYRRHTGDYTVSDGGLWPQPGVTPEALRAAIQRDIPATRQLDFAEPGEIRAASLRIFDRSFAVTYLLELTAIAIGLAGIGASFSAQALARAREFGMLRHLGTTLGELMRLLALEAAGLTLFGVLAGGVLGLAIALVLIHVVNPQSFHWTMELSMPWSLLGSVTALLLAAGVGTALLATRQVTGVGPLRAVREDW